MGQVHVAFVRADALPEVWGALGTAGFAVDRVAVTAPACDEVARCLRGDRQLAIGVCREPEGVYVVVAHPPYSARPWRWGGDVRFFNDLTAVLDRFHVGD